MDAQIERIRAELAILPIPLLRDAEECAEAAIAIGETLSDMAAYWSLASPEEGRDMVWALLVIGGLIYDLEQQVIVGLLPRPDVLPVLALALEGEWEQRDDGLWLRAEHHQKYAARTAVQLLNIGPLYRAHVLTPDQQAEAATLLQRGHSPQQVADQYGVSYWVILRLMKRTAPKQVPTQQQPKLSSAQMAEAHRLLQSGLSMRKVAQRLPGVSYGAIWRMLQRDRHNTGDHGDHPAEEKGGETSKNKSASALDCYALAHPARSEPDGRRIREFHTASPTSSSRITSGFPAYFPLHTALPKRTEPSAHRPHRVPADRWPEIQVRAQAESLRHLAAEYGVSHEAIRRIVNTTRTSDLGRRPGSSQYRTGNG